MVKLLNEENIPPQVVRAEHKHREATRKKLEKLRKDVKKDKKTLEKFSFINGGSPRNSYIF